MNYYADIHANVLPGLAGLGNRPLSEAEAAERLAAMRDSNIKLAVAAPYYLPGALSPDAFLSRRNAAIEAVSSDSQPIRLVPGAVLPLSFCLAQPRSLRQFAVGDSEYFLTDIPPQPVTDEFCEQLSRLRIVSGLCPVAVDINRNYNIWRPEEWIMLRQTDLLMQISTDGLLMQEGRKFSLYLLANQYVHFVSTGSRAIDEPLRFTEAMRIVQRSLPAQIYRRVKNNAGMLLSNAEPAAFL